MFDFFKSQKEFTSCEWLEHGIHFNYDGLDHCCEYFHGGKNTLPVAGLLADHNYDFKKFFKEKKLIRKNARKGIINERCIGCPHLINKKWNKAIDKKITTVAISSFSRCNASCVYCSTSYNKKYFNALKDIPVFDFLKKCISQKIITPDCHIEWGGGEPTIADEFDDIVNFLLDNSFPLISVHSSGIKYSKAIERALREDKCDLIISIDCGTPELYKKIKGVDMFNKVIENIKQYQSVQKNKKYQVVLKYIILYDINDTKEDIINFFNCVIDTGVINVRCDLEMIWYLRNKNNEIKIKKMFELMKFMQEYAKCKNIHFAYNAQASYAIKEHESLYNKLFA